MEPPQVDGYAVDRLIGYGPTGQVWRAQAQQSGDWVALKRLAPAAMACLDRLRREAALVTGLGSPHLVPVRAVVEVTSTVVVISDYVAGDSLETLLACRDGLSVGEAVTLLGPLAAVLAQLHAAGLVHGGLSAANVLIGSDGRPMLTDAGIAVALGDREAEPPDDVRDLAELGVGALGDSDGALVRLLAAIASGPPERIPSADRLATAILATGPAAPIRSVVTRRSPLTNGASLIPGPPTPPITTAPASSPTRRPVPHGRTGADPRRAPRAPRSPRLPVGRPEPAETARRGRISRSQLLAGLAAVLAVGIGGSALRARIDNASGTASPASGTASPASGTASPASSTASPASGTASPAPGTVAAPQTGPPTGPPLTAPSGTRSSAGHGTSRSWRTTVQSLENKRDRAFAAAIALPLEDVYAPNAPALETDRRTIASLRHRGLRAVGFHAMVLAARPVTISPSTATLRVSDRLSAYSLVRRDGAVMQTTAARPKRTYLMTVTRTRQGWRVLRLDSGRVTQSIEASAASSSG